MSSITGKAGAIMLGRFARALIRLGLALAIVRLLTQDQFGSYRQLFLLYDLASVVFLLGIPTSIFYFLPQARSVRAQRGLSAQSAGLLLVSGLALTGGFYLGADFIAASFENPAIAPLIKIFALFPAFDFPIMLLSPILISLNRHRQAALANVAFAVTFATSLLLPLLLGYPLKSAFISLTLVAAFQLLIVLGILTRLFPEKNTGISKRRITKQLRYAVPAGMSGVVTTIAQHLDKLLIAMFFLPATFAVYSIGARELPFVNIIPYAVSAVIFPMLAGFYRDNKIAEILSTWHEAIRKTALIMIPLAFLCFIVSTELITILYTEDYLNSVPIFQTYLLLLPLRVTAYNSVLLALGAPKLVLLGTTASLTVNALLSLAAIPVLGVIGPAIITVVVAYLLAGFFIYQISLRLRKPISALLPWTDLLKISLTALACAAVCLPLRAYFSNPAVLILALSPVFLMLYLLSSTWIGTIKISDMQLLFAKFRMRSG